MAEPRAPQTPASPGGGNGESTRIDRLLSPTLQRVHELREEGSSTRRIAEILEAEGVPLPPGRYQKWNHMGVRACLKQLDALAVQASAAPASDPPSLPPHPPRPGGPHTPASPGESTRIDRDMTPPVPPQKMNYGAAAVLVAVALLFVLWQAGAFSPEEPKTKAAPLPLHIQPTPPVPPPTLPQRPAPLRAPEPFPTPTPLPWFLIPLLLLTALAVGFMNPSPSRVALLALLLLGGVVFHYEFSPQAAALRDYRAWWEVLTTEERRCLVSRHRARQFTRRNGAVEPCVFNEEPWLL